MEPDEINEIRDLSVSLFKRSIELLMNKNRGTGNYIESSTFNKLYKVNKDLFTLYEIRDKFYVMSDSMQKFMDTTKAQFLKLFKPAFENRLKNRRYGKIEKDDVLHDKEWARAMVR